MSHRLPFPPIGDIVPHRPPMLQLDGLTDWAPGKATCRLDIRKGQLFVEQGRVEGPYCLEYMAQAVAACLGYEAYQGGRGPRVGMIVACPRFTLEVEALHVGEAFDVHVEQTGGDDALSRFEGRMARAGGPDAGEVVASAVMTLVHGPKPV